MRLRAQSRRLTGRIRGYNWGVLQRMTDLAKGLAALLLRSHFVVCGESMAPALRDGDLVCAIPRRLLRRPLRRGDIVVARSPMAAHGGRSSPNIIIKRIAGLPGEWIQCDADGAVRIIADAWQADGGGSGASSLTWPCGDGEFFLVGDNRAKSGDSRKYGPVAERAIMGRVWLVAPTHRLRRISRLASLAGHNAGHNAGPDAGHND